jgi:hypothetical protein
MIGPAATGLTTRLQHEMVETSPWPRPAREESVTTTARCMRDRGTLIRSKALQVHVVNLTISDRATSRIPITVV